MALERRAVLAAAALAGLKAQARDPGRLVLGPDRYAPLLQLQDGRPAGLLADRLQAAAASSGDALELQLVTWSRALALARAGQAGLLAASRTPERETWLDFSAPLYVDELQLVVHRKRSFRFQRLADLDGKTLGMARNTTAGAAFDAARAAGRFTVDEDDGLTRRLMALMAGRVDAAVVGGGAWALQRALAQHRQLDAGAAALQVLPRPLLRDPLHLAFPKTQKAGALLRRFDAALKALGLLAA